MSDVTVVTYDELGSDELGGYGYVSPVGIDKLTNLRGQGWWNAVREMTEQDSTVGAVLMAIEMTMRRVSFRWKPANDSSEAEKWRNVAATSIDDMEELWPDKLSEILSFIPWGKCLEELVYKRRLGDNRRQSLASRFDDGLIGWKKWGYRAPETQSKWVREDGDVVAWEQYVKGSRVASIPIEKLLVFRTTARGGDPDGFSVLKRVYIPWYHKKEIQVAEAIGIQRDLAGLFEVRVPDKILKGATNDDRVIRDHWQKIIRNIHRGAQEGLMSSSARDEKGNLITETRLMTSGGSRQFNTTEIVERYRNDQVIGFLASFLTVGMNKVGTQSLAETQVDVFNRAMSAWLDVITMTVQEQGGNRLMKLNGAPQELWPTFEHGDPDSLSLQILGDYVTKLNTAEFLDKEDFALVRELHEVAGLPIPDEKRFNDKIKERKDAADALKQQLQVTGPTGPTSPTGPSTEDAITGTTGVTGPQA